MRWAILCTLTVVATSSLHDSRLFMATTYFKPPRTSADAPSESPPSHVSPTQPPPTPTGHPPTLPTVPAAPHSSPPLAPVPPTPTALDSVACTSLNLKIFKKQMGNYTHTECQFAKSYCSSTFGGGYINYMTTFYCSGGGHLKPLWYGVYGFLVLLIMFLLGDVADRFFCPSLERISQTLRLSPNVAGVTFLAFGNGAPDISSILIGVLSGSGADIGLGEPAGAGLFVTTVVMSAVTIFATVRVTRRPFIRDIVFYIIALLLMWFCLHDGDVHWYEGLSLLLLYAVYVVLVVMGRLVHQKTKKKIKVDEENQKDGLLEEGNATDKGPLIDNGAVNSAQGDEDGSPVFTTKSSWYRRLHSSAPVQVQEALYQYHFYKYKMRARHNLIASEDVPMPEVDPNDTGSQYELESPRRPYDGRKPGIGGAASETCTNTSTVSIAGHNFKSSLQRAWESFGWEDKNIVQRVLFCIHFPFRLLQHLTIPPSSKDPEEWNKIWVVGCGVMAPAVTVMFLKMWGDWKAWVIAESLGIGISLFFYFTTVSETPPPYSILFALISFTMSILWIYAIANEAVNLLEALGVILGVSQTTLAVTVLSWGNSLGDLAADVAVAKQGYPSMAVGAIYGGPMLNLLIGLGLSFTYSALKNDGVYHLRMCTDQAFAFLLLLIGLISALIVIPLSGWKSPKPFAGFLMLLYISYLVVFFLYEGKVLNFDWIPPKPWYKECHS